MKSQEQTGTDCPPATNGNLCARLAWGFVGVGTAVSTALWPVRIRY